MTSDVCDSHDWIVVGLRLKQIQATHLLVVMLREPFCQAKPKSSFIYYYGDTSSTGPKQGANADEEKEEIVDGDVLNMEPVIPSRPR